MALPLCASAQTNRRRCRDRKPREEEPRKRGRGSASLRSLLPSVRVVLRNRFAALHDVRSFGASVGGRRVVAKIQSTASSTSLRVTVAVSPEPVPAPIDDRLGLVRALASSLRNA